MATQSIEAKETTSRPWALASLCLSMLMPSLDTSIANVALPSMADAFGATFQAAQWIVLAYLLAITTLIVGAGRLGDIVGRRRLLLFGIGLFTAASLLCGAAPSLWVLVAARAVQGVGAAIMMSLTVAFASETAAPGRTGSAIGLLGTMSAIGTTIGPALGGALIATSGWRMIFLVNVPLGLLDLALAAQTLPRDGGAGGANRVSPMFRREAFRDPMLGTGLAMSALVSTVMMATLVVGPFYLSRSLGLDAARVGLVMSAGPLVAALSGVVAGRFVDQFGTARMTSAGLAGMAVGLVALSVAPAHFGVAGYVGAVVSVTATYALFQAANNTAIMSGARQDQRGVISGLLGLSRNLGLISGASVMGAIFAGGGMRTTFLVAAVLVLAALAMATRARRRVGLA